MTLPATTADSICTRALRKLGVIAAEEVPTAAESTDALISLNQMLQAWNVERLSIYNITPEVFPFVPGQGTYTIGPGGQFNTDRPVKIESTYVRDSQGNDYKMQVTTNYKTYSDIITKYTQSTLPTVCYDDGNFPLKNLYFWSIPNNSGFSAVLWVWKQLPQFATLSDNVILPPGYARALEYNLAVELGPEFGRAISEDLSMLAQKSKSSIQRLNYNIKELNFDSTIVRRGRVFNYLNGE